MDGLTWRDYEADLERRLADLHDRVHRGAYRAQPSRRRYIPKPDGRQRPLAVAALEDKIVQKATVAVLNAIYEEDFLGFSYGFRPGRGQHDALDALVVGITGTKVNHILDCDIRSFFDHASCCPPQEPSSVSNASRSSSPARSFCSRSRVLGVREQVKTRVLVARDRDGPVVDAVVNPVRARPS